MSDLAQEQKGSGVWCLSGPGGSERRVKCSNVVIIRNAIKENDPFVEIPQ